MRLHPRRPSAPTRNVENLEDRRLLSALQPSDFAAVGLPHHARLDRTAAVHPHHQLRHAPAHAPAPARHVTAGVHPMHTGPLTGADAGPAATTATSGYTPAQIRQAYGIDGVTFAGVKGDGTGQTIAIVDAYDDPNIASDLAAFDAQYGLPAPPKFIKLNQNGSTSSLPGRDSSGGWEMEEALDVEWAHAVAPGANIVLVEARSSATSDLLAAVKTAAGYSVVGAGGVSQPVSVVSMSWGGGEFSGETSYDSSFSTPSGHAPVTFVASSGDNGAPVSWPSVSPNVLSVGGTAVTISSPSAGVYQWAGETGWSGSGGGVGAGYEAQPTYQQGVVTQTTTARANPDVAYNASPSPGFSVYDSYPYYGRRYNWTSVGGTSAGAPQWAALEAVADQGRAAAGKPALTSTPSQQAALKTDLTQSVLYNLFYTAGYASTYFHDVASGASTGTPNYSAGANYDLVTGLGTPYAGNVVAALVTPPPVSAFGAPTGVTASADAAGPIALSWTPVAGASSYDVYGYDATANPGGGPFQLLFSTAASAAENTGVTPGHAYVYQVVARSTTQGASSPSAPTSPVTAASSSLFTDDFNNAANSANWTYLGAAGAWQRDDAVNHTLSQTNSTTAVDPQKAVVTAAGTQATASTPSLMISAQFQVTSWKPGEYARVGVGLDTNSASGAGYGIAVRDRNGGQHNTLQFLNDGVAWGNQYAFAVSLNAWYNVKMESRGGVLYANVWAADGTTAEPATWQFVQAGWGDRTGGYAALNGSSVGTFQTEALSGATAAFRHVAVTGG